jgi:hypothetical protein
MMKMGMLTMNEKLKINDDEQKLFDYLSKLIVNNCVRNTFLEDLHALGKISNTEMKKLMKEIVNKVYTTLVYQNKFGNIPIDYLGYGYSYPIEWDKAEIDQDLIGIWEISVRSKEVGLEQTLKERQESKKKSKED